MIKSVNIIGAGNVATHLAKNLMGKVQIKSIYSKSLKNACELSIIVDAKGVDSIDKIDQSVDLNIVALKDDVIATFTKQFPAHIPIVHTSGSVNMDVLQSFMHYGILYPLQSFTKYLNIELNGVPFLIEANTNEFETQLINFCQENLSNQTFLADSYKRSQIHLAAVVSNNFITYLLSQSALILKNNDLELDILKPLLIETLKKSFEIGPKKAQTGPAKRGDALVVANHIKQIKNPKLKEVYRLISELISEQN